MGFRAQKLGLLFVLVTTAFLSSCGRSGSSDDSDDTEFPPAPPPITNRVIPIASSLTCPNGTALTYENFGHGFFLNYCSSCHSKNVPADLRVGAPATASFDTLTDVASWRLLILESTASESPTMPPSGHVGADEVALLSEWLNCGAPTDQ